MIRLPTKVIRLPTTRVLGSPLCGNESGANVGVSGVNIGESGANVGESGVIVGERYFPGFT